MRFESSVFLAVNNNTFDWPRRPLPTSLAPLPLPSPLPPHTYRPNQQTQVDVTPIIPALTNVFNMALAGGGAKSINFQALAADLAQITFDYPFRIPPYFALIIRAIGVLEGIALVREIKRRRRAVLSALGKGWRGVTVCPPGEKLFSGQHAHIQSCPHRLMRVFSPCHFRCSAYNEP